MWRSLVRQLLRNGSTFKRWRSFRKVHFEFQAYTMIPENYFIKNLLIADDQRAVQGCVVECGVWRGGMSAGMARVLGTDRDYYLFDGFQGMPPAREIDGRRALDWQANTTSPLYLDNCRVDMSIATEAMRRSGATRVHIIKGWFDQTLPSFRPVTPIAILRLDGDWYDSTMTCLKFLVPFLAADAVVVVDDYYQFEGCRLAVYDYFTQRRVPAIITQAYNEICVIQGCGECSVDGKN